MKTAEDIIYDAWGVKATDLVFLMQPDSLVRIIKQSQQDAYNQALEDAAKNVRMFKAGNSGSWLDAAINTDSILKLKKK